MDVASLLVLAVTGWALGKFVEYYRSAKRLVVDWSGPRGRLGLMLKAKHGLERRAAGWLLVAVVSFPVGIALYLGSQ